MTQEKPTTLRGRCTKMVNRDNLNEVYMRNQPVNNPTDARTDKTTGTFSTHHLHPECYMICPQVNRQELNEVMDALQKVNKDVNTLFNITDILTQHLRYQQIYTYAHTILAYLRNSLTYMKQVAINTMDYINVAAANIFSPDILLVELRNMLRYIKSQLPSIMHLPISLDDTFHFYQYPNTHILTAERQHLLLIDVLIQDRVQ